MTTPQTPGMEVYEAQEQAQVPYGTTDQWRDIQVARAEGDFPRNSYGVGVEIFRVVSSLGCTLYGFTVYNSGASTVYVGLFNGNAQPASGAHPVVGPWQVGANQTLTVSYPPPGRRFRQACVLASSSTDTTYTATTAVCTFDAQYV